MEENKKEENVEERISEPLIYRIHRAIGPLAGGLILDFVDLATFGPLGIVGLFIGGLIGWWVSSIYNFSKKARLLWAMLAAIYCLFPLTELIPVATIISAFARFEENPKYKKTK